MAPTQNFLIRFYIDLITAGLDLFAGKNMP